MAARIRCVQLFRHAKLHLQRQQCCQYLSAAYRCDDVWKKRLDHPLLKDIIPAEYIYDLEQKYKREGKVSAIDVDLFVNRVADSKSDRVVDEVESLLHKLRRSPESIHTLPSTHHATLRLLLHADQTDILLKILDNPMNYGIFLDHYTANLLMDTFMECKNYTAAARVASGLMLQEDFGPLLTQALTLASCFAYVTAKADALMPWEDYTPKVEEPEEEVKIRIRYLRNPYFDDHFDLKDPEQVVGKTLAWVSPLLGGTVGASGEVLGWALYKKWTQLTDTLARINDSDDLAVASSVVNRLKDIIMNFKEGGKDESSGAIESVSVALSRLEGNPGKVVEVDLQQSVQDLVTQATSQTQQASDIQAQVEVYKSWEKRREEEFQSQLEAYRKRELLAVIEEKKKDLAAREQVICFFDNQDKLEMLTASKGILPRKTQRAYKKKVKKVDESYVPPTLR